MQTVGRTAAMLLDDGAGELDIPGGRGVMRIGHGNAQRLGIAAEGALI